MLIDYFMSARPRRRGIILVVILGMLALMALIGVTFATFSGQARINARNFSQSKNNIGSAEMMEFALTQLIYDTANPLSAIRGHSLLRDMYGNDATHNGYLTVQPSSGNPIVFPYVQVLQVPVTFGMTTIPAGYVKCVTNLSINDPSLYGYDFTRWIVKFPGGNANNNNYGSPTYFVSQTYEVVVDDYSGQDLTYPSFHIFYVPQPDTNTYYSVDTTVTSQLVQSYPANATSPIPTNFPFELDGRYLHAFNGSGMSGMGLNAAYGNFRINSKFGYDADFIHMDEDYDACDLENWFLAIQSADGQVIIPSFHRPGILRADPSDPNYPINPKTDIPIPLSPNNANDWRNTSADSAARFLRPRAVDGHNALAFPDLLPDPATGTITCDVDNDGDGITDSVWLDLGYPTTTDAKGMAFKPLFAFLIIGLNGRLPLNTAGNLQLRDASGAPKYSHAAHLGNSPSEIDPTFALQAPHHVNPNTGNLDYSQVDDADVLVNLTQFRNILTGTIPQPNPFQTPSPTVNQDANRVMFGTDAKKNPIYYCLPNSGADIADLSYPQVFRTGIPVAGRWGEVDFISGNPNSNPPRPVVNGFNNPIRAGMSMTYYDHVSNTFLPYDLDDDNFNTFDTIGSPPENLDYNDAAGALSVPVERIRRYTTPIDAAGDGWMTTYPSTSETTPANGPSGADNFGRISFYKYFRPPGMPNTMWSGGPVAPTIPDTSTNPLHGFESARNPNMYALNIKAWTASLTPRCSRRCRTTPRLERQRSRPSTP